MTKAEWKHQWVCHRCGRTKPISIKQTNADKIKQMSDKELAEWIAGYVLNLTGGSLKMSKQAWLDWLKQEASDECL
jgi:hypothetical protein